MGSETSRHERSFEHLYRRWYPVVRRTAMKMLHDPDDAEDVAQEVFHRLLRKGTWREIDAPARYFRSAGIKAALCVQRDRRGLVPIGQTEVDRLPFQGPGPEELATQAEYRRILKEHLARLPERCAKTMALVALGGRSHAEAAVPLGITANAVGKQIARGRVHLRRYLLLDENGDLRKVSTFEDGGE